MFAELPTYFDKRMFLELKSRYFSSRNFSSRNFSSRDFSSRDFSPRALSSRDFKIQKFHGKKIVSQEKILLHGSIPYFLD